MKIPASTMAAFQRETVRPNQAPRTERVQAETNASPDRSAPPGLERVLERLQALGESGRTAGQTQAMDRIGRNLARYVENQALATPAAGGVPVQEPAPEAVEPPPEGPPEAAADVSPPPQDPTDLLAAQDDEPQGTAGA